MGNLFDHPETNDEHDPGDDEHDPEDDINPLSPNRPFLVGYAFMSKKIGRMGAVLNGSGLEGIHFEQIDFGKKYNSSHWDLIVHKLSEDVMNRDTDSASNHRLSFIEKYVESNSKVVLIDGIDAISNIVSRALTCEILKESLAQREDRIVHDPKFCVILEEEQSNTLKIAEKMKASNLNFPVICKPVEACGTSASHHLTIILNEEGLSDLKAPCVMQEYINHDTKLLKVYVLGPKTFVFPRKSLPNLNDGGSFITDNQNHRNSSNMSQPRSLCFDSQKPYPTSEDFGLRDIFSKMGDAKADSRPSEEVVNQIASMLQSTFRLSLFGFDLIKSSADKKLYIVDINYFPSFKEVKDFPIQFRKYLRYRIEEHLASC